MTDFESRRAEFMERHRRTRRLITVLWWTYTAALVAVLLVGIAAAVWFANR